MKFKIVDIDQTGVAIFLDEDGKEVTKPLFSDAPCWEARRLLAINNKLKVLKNVYYANNLLDYRMEDMVKDYASRNKNLPENYIDEIASGFPFIIGNCYSNSFFYA